MGAQSTHFDTLVTASSQAGREERPEVEVTRWGITQKGMEYLECWRQQLLQRWEPEHPGDTAPLRRSNKPFSLLK